MAKLLFSAVVHMKGESELISDCQVVNLDTYCEKFMDNNLA